MAEPIQCVLFDLGETLVHYGHADTLRMFKAGTKLTYEYLRDRGYRLPPFRRYFMRQLLAIRLLYLLSNLIRRDFNAAEALTRGHAKMGIQITPEQGLELAWLFYRPLSETAATDPEAREVLEELRNKGLRLGLVSNTFLPPETLDRHLEREGLLEYLPMRVYSSATRYRKPDRRIFEAARQQIGVHAEAILFVGDSPGPDVRGANRAGMVSVLKDPTGRYDGRRVRPAYRIRRLRELPALVLAHGRA